MSATYLVGIDGSEQSINAALYAADQASHCGASLMLAYVIEWSGFDIMGPEELAERHKIREAEIQRAQDTIVQPMLEALNGKISDVETNIHHGHAAKTLLDLVEEHQVGHIFLGRHGASRLSIAMVGSTTNSIIQASKVPVTVVP